MIYIKFSYVNQFTKFCLYFCKIGMKLLIKEEFIIFDIYLAIYKSNVEYPKSFFSPKDNSQISLVKVVFITFETLIRGLGI